MMDYPEALKQAPSMVGELRRRIMPDKGEKPEISAPAQMPSAPLSIHAMADCDSLYSLLYRHAENVADMLRSKMPTVPIVGDWEPVGLPAGTTPEAAYDHAFKLARYLEHQTHMVPIEWERKISREIVKCMDRLSERYPTHEPPERLNARCRECERLTLDRYAPKRYRGDERFKCQSCGLHHAADEVAVQLKKREDEIK